MLVTVDTGGTKTLITTFDHDGQPGAYLKFATPKLFEDYLEQLTEELHGVIGDDHPDGIVIGIPGVIKDNMILWCGNLPWSDCDLAGPIGGAFNCPVWLANDADLAGLAETRSLAKTPDLSLYVTISTGIGTGIIIRGNLDPALGGSEGGHCLVEYDGRVRMWEDFAAGSAIKATYGKYARDISDPKVWNQIADKISRGFLALLPALQPDVIIIGGSIGTYFDNYGDQLERLLREHLPPHIKLGELRQAAHPEEAVIYGGYYYGSDQLAS